MPDLALLPLKAVRERVGIGTTSIYKGIAEGTFPKPYKQGTRSLWFSEDIDAWILKQVGRTIVGQNMGQNVAA